MWQDKANELNVDVGHLLVWYKSIRTKYTKLTYKKSGTATKQLTDRDKWIISKLSFLTGHIYRMTGRQTSSLKETIAESQASGSQQHYVPEDSGSEADEEESMVEDQATQETQSQPVQAEPSTPASGRHTTPPPSAPLPKTSGWRKTKRKAQQLEADSQSLLDCLQTQKKSAEDLQATIQLLVQQTSDYSSARGAWGLWLTAMLPKVHDRHLPNFFQKSFKLMQAQVQESDYLRQQEAQHQLQLMQQQQQQVQQQPYVQPQLMQQQQQQQQQPYVQPTNLPTYTQLPNIAHLRRTASVTGTSTSPQVSMSSVPSSGIGGGSHGGFGAAITSVTLPSSSSGEVPTWSTFGPIIGFPTVTDATSQHVPGSASTPNLSALSTPNTSQTLLDISLSKFSPLLSVMSPQNLMDDPKDLP